MSAPTSAAMGNVVAHAVTIRPAVDHRTGVPRPRPPPRTEPVATCVVDRANPRWLAESRTAAVEPSLDMPCRGVMSTSPLPSVRMMRQPPR
jgi:hypothetical protein